MVSRLALGLAFRGQTDEHEMNYTIGRALDHGINFLDCANDYGRTPAEPHGGLAERALGRAVAGRRDEVVVTTKVSWDVGPGPNDRGGSRYHILREIDRSLGRLHMEHVDLYLLHRRDQLTPFEETVGAMADVIRGGKARYWGVCNFQVWETCKIMAVADRLGAPRPICVQNPYNLLNRLLEWEMIPFCREERRGIMAYSPMALGLLTGLYRPGKPVPPGTLWATSRKHLYESAFTAQAAAVLEEVERIASVRGCPPSQVALNWVLSHPEVTVAIVGCDTPEQVDANMGAADWSLSEEELSELDRVSLSAPLTAQ